MQIWKDIVKLSLIGTERGEMPNSLKKELESMGISTNKDSAEIVLTASALLSKMQKAGYQPIKNTMQLLPPAPEEQQSLCSQKSVRHLRLILNGSYKDALPEYLNTLAETGKRLPEEVLPDILEMGKNKQKQWELLRKIIGERGEWLVRQNPDWQYIMLDNRIENWETGSKTERLALLRHWRKIDPEQALQMIQNTWSVENINNKIDFLKLLEINLSEGDEAFLEQRLDAKRKEERKLAAKLLTKIPNAQLVQRMFDRVAAMMTIDKRKRLQIQLPDELDDATLRDGIDARTQWIRGGVKASRFGQMLAVVPPTMLEEHFDTSPKKILELYWQSDWRELLFQATLEATAIHNNDFWTDAIFTFWLKQANNQDLSDFININPLLENTSENMFNKIAIMGLSSAYGLLEENHPIVHLLKLSPHSWQPQLTKVFVQNLQNWMQTSQTYWAGWHYKGILKKAAYHSEPSSILELEHGWPREQRIWGTWEREVDEFLNVLRFRKVMLEALK